MFNKIISLILIAIIPFSTIQAKKPKVSKEEQLSELLKSEFTIIAPEENLTQDLKTLDFSMLYLKSTVLPFVIPSSSPSDTPSFYVDGQGLFCMNIPDYNGMSAQIKTIKFNQDSLVDLERKKCKKQRDLLKKQADEREATLNEKIEKVQRDLSSKQKEYKSLQNKMFWVQVGSGVAILTISGFAIYSSQR